MCEKFYERVTVMKILKALGLVLSFAWVSVGFSAESNSIERSIFTGVDLELARLYPGTLKGHQAIAKDVHIINAVRVWDDDFIAASAADVSSVRSYYLGKFFAFMDGLRERNSEDSATPEFNALFQNICTEAQEAAQGKLSDLNWHMIKVMFIRGLLLASGEGDEGARDLLNIVPGTELFFGALLETPSYLLENGEGTMPAWKHSSKACVHNTACIDQKNKDRFRRYPNIGSVDYDIISVIEGEIKSAKIIGEVNLPVVGFGKIGITTLVKTWLKHVFILPLPYGEYEAHGFKLGAAVGAQHDDSHKDIDNRKLEVMQAILNLLNKAYQAKKPVRKAVPLATAYMVERYKMFNETLLEFVESKERITIAQLRAAIELAPDDKNNEHRKADERLARQQYNTGVAALFQVLREEYAMKANVLEASTFEEAITALCDNVGKEDASEFDELNTFFNARSDLTDADIFEKIKSRTLESLKIYPAPDSSKTTHPVTIGDYLEDIDMESLEFRRGPVVTEVRFDTLAGQSVVVQTLTTHFLVNTARDENALLRLVGKGAPELDWDTLRALPTSDVEGRNDALAQVKTWLGTIDENIREMATSLGADVLANTPVDLIARYNALVAAQNAEWDAVHPANEPVVIPSFVVPKADDKESA